MTDLRAKIYSMKWKPSWSRLIYAGLFSLGLLIFATVVWMNS